VLEENDNPKEEDGLTHVQIPEEKKVTNMVHVVKEKLTKKNQNKNKRK
jgi:hypothetical protein